MVENMNKYKKIKLRNGKTIDEHRMVMQQIIGRRLESFEVVHHKDGDKSNNHPDNLELMTLSEHSRLHMIGKRPNLTREQLIDYGRRNRTNATLSIEAVREIKKLLLLGELSYSQIGKIYSVRRETIYKIKKGRSWSWLTS